MTTADLLRLLAVPVFAWAAYRDVKTRRVPTRTWYPLVALGVVLLAWDAWRVFVAGGAPFARRLFLTQVGISIGVLVPFAYLVWWFGGFGGADAKALMTLAVLFPTFPTYVIDLGTGTALVLPTNAGRTALGVFSLTILTNTVVLGAASPLALTLRNLAAGHVSWVMVVGRKVPVASLPERHGSLLETPDGVTRSGLDLDALRMYLRWRDADLEELLADPEAFRDPASLPDQRFEPGGGAVDAGAPEPLEPREPREDAATDGEPDAAQDGGGDAAVDDAAPDGDREGVDEWGAAAFLADVGWGAYGTDPEDLQAGLELLAEREAVWYSPGLPFVVPMFVGLLVGLTFGDLLFGLLEAVGLVAVA